VTRSVELAGIGEHTAGIALVEELEGFDVAAGDPPQQSGVTACALGMPQMRSLPDVG
jgi:hypothetical protein